jgi:hypothetical protein
MTPRDYRAALLTGLKPFIDDFIAVANGEQEKFTCTNNFAITEAWELIKELVTQADDPTTIAWNGSAHEKIDAVLSQVAAGQLSPDEGKRLIALVSAGYEITELEDIRAKLEELTDS